MNYVSNESSMQAYRQQLSYKTSVTAVDKTIPLKNANTDESDGTILNNALNLPIVYNNEKDMPSIDKAKKMLMESIMAQFSQEGESFSFFPNDISSMNQNKPGPQNPYSEQFSQNPSGFMYESSYEYYEKTTIEFNAQATIKTPQGEYQIDISFSYTEEFYEKNQTQIVYAHSNSDKPFEINLDEDDESLKNLKHLHLIFDVIKEENEEEKTLLDEIKEILQKRQQMLLQTLDSNEDKGVGSTKDDNKGLDNFRVFEKHENEENSLLAIKKNGVGVFLANSHSSSSYVSAAISSNGVSIHSGYSQSSQSVGLITDLKA